MKCEAIITTILQYLLEIGMPVVEGRLNIWLFQNFHISTLKSVNSKVNFRCLVPFDTQQLKEVNNMTSHSK